MFATLQSQCLKKCLKIGFLNIIYSFQYLEKNGAPTWGSMPHRGPWSEYFHCNDYRFANPKHNAGASGWYTQRYHRFKGHRPWLTTGVTAPNPHAPRATAHRPAPLQAGARHTGRGLRVGVVDSFSKTWFETSDHSRKRSHCVPQAL